MLSHSKIQDLSAPFPFCSPTCYGHFVDISHRTYTKPEPTTHFIGVLRATRVLFALFVRERDFELPKRCFMKALLLACSLTIGNATANAGKAAELNPVVVSWLAAQTNIQSWSADFVQTRSFKSLTQPLTATGHVWFAAPNRFRWELGNPAQTIAVRGSNDLLVIYPRLKRVERFPLSGEQAGPWKDALALLEAGFPRSAHELQAQYNILDQVIHEPIARLVLQPKSSAARRMMPQIKIEFDTRDFSLRATELQFADGSSLRNDFTHAVLNPAIEPQQFSPPIPADYKIVEPLKQ